MIGIPYNVFHRFALAQNLPSIECTPAGFLVPFLFTLSRTDFSDRTRKCLIQQNVNYAALKRCMGTNTVGCSDVLNKIKK